MWVRESTSRYTFPFSYQNLRHRFKGPGFNPARPLFLAWRDLYKQKVYIWHTLCFKKYLYTLLIIKKMIETAEYHSELLLYEMFVT